MSVHAHPLPDDALLQGYASDPSHYTDCFVKDVAGTITLPDYITAFYTTPLFRAERFVLKLGLGKPSTDYDVRALSTGQATQFAAWTVEARTDTQLLMCDLGGHTRSWFMVAPTTGGTRLFFGSAVTPATSALIKAIGPLHRLYARALLAGTKP